MEKRTELKIYHSAIKKQIEAKILNNANGIKYRQGKFHLGPKMSSTLLQWLTKNNQNLEPSGQSQCCAFYTVTNSSFQKYSRLMETKTDDNYTSQS